MAIAETISLSFAENLPILPRAEGPLGQFNPLGGYMRPWFVSHQLAGLTGGGAVDLTVEVRPELGNGPIFLSVAQVRMTTNDTTAGSFVKFSGDADDEYQYGKNEVRKTTDITELFAANDLVVPENPMIFGSLEAGLSGGLFCSFQTNTDAKLYRVSIHGWISDRPYLTPLTLFPA